MRIRSVFGWLARAGGVVALVSGQLAFTAGGAHAATFSVTNGNDSGAGSLRQAILDASTAAGDDTVVVDDAVNTITLTTGMVLHAPADNAALTLQGNGVTIQQNTADSRVIGSASTGLLTVDAATISGGSGTLGDSLSGAGIGSFGPVTITNSTVSNNATTVAGGGGIASQGAVILTSSTVSNNTAVQSGGGILGGAVTLNSGSTVSDNTVSGGTGGGVFASGAVTVTGSSVSGNDATEGTGIGASGGIFGAGTVTITNSTVSGNTGTATNGGAPAGGVGAVGAITATDSMISGNMSTTNSGDTSGGLGSSGSDITLERSTVNGNTATSSSGAAAGGVGTFGDVSATNSTVTGNSGTATTDVAGGIGANDVTLLHATVVENTGSGAGNVSALDGGDNGSLTTFGSVIADPLGGGTNCVLGTDGTTSTGYNYADDTSCGLVHATDSQNVANDPMLGALVNNGGATQTRLPQAGSALINAVPSGSCNGAVTTDQRGVGRPQGPGCDIGSVEVTVTPPPSTAPPTCPATQASLGAGSVVGTEGLVAATPAGAYAVWRRRRRRPATPRLGRARSLVTLIVVVGLAVVVLAACAGGVKPPPPPFPGC